MCIMSNRTQLIRIRILPFLLVFDRKHSDSEGPSENESALPVAKCCRPYGACRCCHVVAQQAIVAAGSRLAYLGPSVLFSNLAYVVVYVDSGTPRSWRGRQLVFALFLIFWCTCFCKIMAKGVGRGDSSMCRRQVPGEITLLKYTLLL